MGGGWGRSRWIDSAMDKAYDSIEGKFRFCWEMARRIMINEINIGVCVVLGVSDQQRIQPRLKIERSNGRWVVSLFTKNNLLIQPLCLAKKALNLSRSVSATLLVLFER